MKVLVACEFSGIVRDAFRAKGHDAWSCDLLPTEKEGPHLQCDVLTILDNNWDLMIAHPPCTYISYAGIRYWNGDGRIFLRLKALEFFAKLWTAPINKICIENPKGCASPVIKKYSQEIQPHYFGEPHKKTTWLWLKNLPSLVPTQHVEPIYRVQYRKPGKYYKGGEIKKRYITDFTGRATGKQRSVFWHGIADAMADQWGNL